MRTIITGLIVAFTLTGICNADGMDQQRCFEKAHKLASGARFSHGNTMIGDFEGIGMGSNPNCKTCTPQSRMVLTGDASVRGSNGYYYRVRSWRHNVQTGTQRR